MGFSDFFCGFWFGDGCVEASLPCTSAKEAFPHTYIHTYGVGVAGSKCRIW